MKLVSSLSFFLLLLGDSLAQSTNDILLISNKTISQSQSDSVSAEAAILQEQTDVPPKSFFLTAARQMQLTGYSQIRYQFLQERGKHNVFDILRARADLKGSVTPVFSYRLQVDFAGQPKLIDAYCEIKLADYFSLTGGQFKIPFSIENMTSSNILEMIDRSQVVEALVARSKDVIWNQNGRDIGIQGGYFILPQKLQALAKYDVYDPDTSTAVPVSYCQEKSSGQISISGAFALYPMVINWADEYKKINPGVRFDISAGGAGKGISDVLNGMVEIGMASREIYPEEIKKGAFPIAVTKDAVVAVVSESNPALNEILSKGLKKDAANNIWITGRYTTWAQAFSTKMSSPIHIYTRSDACGAAEMWAKFFGKKQEDLLGVGVFGDPGLAQAVKKDPLGIGYNNIGYAYDATNRKQINGLRVVPVDLNNNGKIDSDEDFYSSMNDLIAAIASGKYPSPPARELYFVMKGNPKNNKILTEFIRWVLTDGQKFINEAGYISLPKEKIETEQKKLQ